MAARRHGRPVYCTYDDSNGGRVKARQEWRDCLTCAASASTRWFRVCAVCATACHPDHQLGPVHASRIVCDCATHPACIMRIENAKSGGAVWSMAPPAATAAGQMSSSIRTESQSSAAPPHPSLSAARTAGLARGHSPDVVDLVIAALAAAGSGEVETEAVLAQLASLADASTPSAAGECGAGSDDDNECVICMDASRELAVVPCGHRCLCRGCGAPGLCPDL
ncbi:uncharacterized protein AMSG_05232 [Thecamonas trahens ATCC 50062]|uniref:RING-type domain-containing protein n=1 Tax=Thecamonas trahens ATCC 50062 TaxID=461836 RepID=A0A0L0DAX5_THETB|nr:hypothetical protein AMSG_05232 [Thecamonas trahens ATCC 50062]KNC49241.1 hypothetical protein AMSG_05232 [Thecamonas trahens ATCC 50062]|eukprot:XP_013757957.1 hypothetical protein AMSG_05232 [Thecamonas trahens ATCC 50062]